MFANESPHQLTKPQKQQPPSQKETKWRNRKHYTFYGKNNAKTKHLWRTVEDTARHQFESIGSVINLSNKIITKETSQFLNKYNNFIPTPNVFSKN